MIMTGILFSLQMWQDLATELKAFTRLLGEKWESSITKQIRWSEFLCKKSRTCVGSIMKNIIDICTRSMQTSFTIYVRYRDEMLHLSAEDFREAQSSG
ncbi:hypothetical protein AVEN_78185-1 [Araneus ventricosus]|uniref:Uncharacterized protein n=1 Tax=Araneus ventricosus TaxID=182803 RepID=A0A4Y2WMW6_ARAVE|nr:hypothetical protein AVEN_25038-1 [Araneus ventricosus]GBO38401.1 hypothetical protein AVEN_78185-1 [Araneus ventricosus]